MTDQELKDLVASLAVAQMKTDAQLAKTDAKLDRLSEMYGGVGRNQGYAAEEFFYNCLVSNPTLEGIRYDFIDKNITRHGAGLQAEFDILLINGQDVAIIEVKYRAHPRDLKKITQTLAPRFKTLFPQYADYRHHLYLTVFSIDDELMNEALDAGVSVLQRQGEVIVTRAA